MEWGDPEEASRRLEPYAGSIETERHSARFTFASVEAATQFFEQLCKPAAGGVLLENEYLAVLARKS